MALMQALAALLGVCGLCLGFASLGNSLLKQIKFEMPGSREHLLVSAGIGLLSAEIFLFAVQLTRHIRAGSFVLIAILALSVVWEHRDIWNQLRRALTLEATLRPFFKLLLGSLGAVLLVEFLVSQAPLTGSDALNYHFAIQKLTLQYGFHPTFSNFHGFLCGQHHLLILFALALGSEHLALGLLFLGGVLTAAALACLASRWTSPQVAIIVTLLFLLTPLVFWQVCTSGSPDIFMAFFVCVAVLVLSHEGSPKRWQLAVIAGFLAGGIAGAKYTGIPIAAAFLAATAFEFKSVAEPFYFALASLLSGVWPYARNFMWTGDPVFPVLAAKLAPHLVTSAGLGQLAQDTGASTTHHFAQLLSFELFAGVRPDAAPGLWDFFGPAVVALAPLIFFAFQNTRTWRVSLFVWFFSGLAIFFSSGLPRFTLPIFPLALAGVGAGWQASRERNWRMTYAVTAALIGGLFFMGLAGLTRYSAKPMLAATGRLSKTEYLREYAPDYQIAEATNRTLATQRDSACSSLLFVRHLYYFEIRYLNGDPGTSFVVDPDRLRTANDWRQFFREKGICFVVRAPEYPQAIAEPLSQLENEGYLSALAEADIQNFEGNRLEGIRKTVPVMILQVKRR